MTSILLQLQDFRDILLTEDEKVAEELNSIYKVIELSASLDGINIYMKILMQV